MKTKKIKKWNQLKEFFITKRKKIFQVALYEYLVLILIIMNIIQILMRTIQNVFFCMNPFLYEWQFKRTNNKHAKNIHRIDKKFLFSRIGKKPQFNVKIKEHFKIKYTRKVTENILYFLSKISLFVLSYLLNLLYTYILSILWDDENFAKFIK